MQRLIMRIYQHYEFVAFRAKTQELRGKTQQIQDKNTYLKIKINLA